MKLWRSQKLLRVVSFMNFWELEANIFFLVLVLNADVFTEYNEDVKREQIEQERRERKKMHKPEDDKPETYLKARIFN